MRKTKNKEGNKLFIFTFFSLFSILFISLTSAYGYSSGGEGIHDLGYYSPGSCIELLQTCQRCSANNISSILISNGGNTQTLLLYKPALIMSSIDNHTFNFTFCNTSSLGTYFINGIGNEILAGATDETENWTYQFEIGLPIWMIILIMIFGYGVAILGFLKYKNEWISMAGGMVMLIMGIYLISYGIEIYNNTLTLVIGYITVALGGVATLVPIGEELERNLNWFDHK